ncbi:metallophosphoesterase [candidate division KSB1 bacterium]|nr:metallophosphoesterase [candidate division KSB1 bacterium]MBL7094534.1 metallophosphoesterase [candidate division KSB1 bacterium]
MKLNRYNFLLVFLVLILSIIFCDSVEKPEFTFGVVTDIQYMDAEPHKSRFYRSSVKKLEECVQVFNSKDLEFVIQLGDLIEKDFASYDTIMPILEKIKHTKYHVLGNHEFTIRSRYYDSLMDRIGLEKRYYDFKINSWRFIVLDGNDISIHSTKHGSEERKEVEELFNTLVKKKTQNMQRWNGSIGEQQLEWLQNKLEKSCHDKEKVIIFCHFPVLPREWHSLWNDEEVYKTIEAYDCVVAYISGHNHWGNYVLRNNIHYLTIKGMVETADTNAFAVVEVYPDSLNVIGYGREPGRTLNIIK